MMEQQCLGTTRSGERCRVSRGIIDGYCHLHRRQAEAAPHHAPPSAEPAQTPRRHTGLHKTSAAPAVPLVIAAFLAVFLLLAALMRRSSLFRISRFPASSHLF